ncbi:MAG TPA: hypothetical protein PK788_12595, partial [Gemmatimonadaceae bacterium]|nr:hypothetical protein [Gemmatimonadaceae bacterium]
MLVSIRVPIGCEIAQLAIPRRFFVLTDGSRSGSWTNSGQAWCRWPARSRRFGRQRLDDAHLGAVAEQGVARRDDGVAGGEAFEDFRPAVEIRADAHAATLGAPVADHVDVLTARRADDRPRRDDEGVVALVELQRHAHAIARAQPVLLGAGDGDLDRHEAAHRVDGGEDAADTAGDVAAQRVDADLHARAFAQQRDFQFGDGQLRHQRVEVGHGEET